MTDKKDAAAKDAGRLSESASVKRPHATLDLKASEVRDSAAKPAASGDAAKTESAAAAKDSASSAASAASASSTAKAAPQLGQGKPHPAPPPRAPRSGAILTHLLAGLAGGGLALAGITALAPKPKPAVAPAEFAERTTKLEERIASLESAAAVVPVAAEPVADELKGKLADAESRLAKLEEESRQIATLTEAQAKLASEAKELADKVASTGAAEADRERIGRLEQRLQLLSAAAAAEPDGGRISQLAAITDKISAIETSLATELTAAKTSIGDETKARLEPIEQVSAAAKAGVEAAERDLTGLREEQARLTQRLEALKADTERLSATSHVLQEEGGSLTSALGQLKASVEAQVRGLARPSDVQAAVAPVSSRLGALEHSLAGVVKSEEERRANAERVVLSLELANLKRVIESGQGYAAELAEIRKVAGGRVNLAVLETYKDEGVPTAPGLVTEFKPIMNATIDADTEPTEGGVVERLIAGAKSVVRVRKISYESDDKSAEAVVARMDGALKEGRLGDVLELAREVPQRASAPMQDWLGKVEARLAVDRAIASLEDQLKASLGGAAAAPAHEPGSPAVK